MGDATEGLVHLLLSNQLHCICIEYYSIGSTLGLEYTETKLDQTGSDTLTLHSTTFTEPFQL